MEFFLFLRCEFAELWFAQRFVLVRIVWTVTCAFWCLAGVVVGDGGSKESPKTTVWFGYVVEISHTVSQGSDGVGQTSFGRFGWGPMSGGDGSFLRQLLLQGKQFGHRHSQDR